MKFVREVRIYAILSAIWPVLFFIVFPFLAEAQEEPGPDLLWRARGLQAVTRMDSLSKELEKNYTLSLQILFLVENAYALFALPENPPIFKTDTITVYHMMFNLSTDEKNDTLTDVGFVYENATGNFLGVRIDGLEEGVSAFSLAKAPDIISLSKPSEPNFPSIFIGHNFPFQTTVYGD